MPRVLMIKLDPARISDAMKSRRLLVCEAQAEAGISHTSWYRAVRGEPVGVRCARQIADALRVPLNSVASNED